MRFFDGTFRAHVERLKRALVEKFTIKVNIMDCKLFSQSDCKKLVYLPRPPHLWYNTHCTRNIVTHQLQSSFVNYFHNIFGTMVQYFLQCSSLRLEVRCAPSAPNTAQCCLCLARPITAPDLTARPATRYPAATARPHPALSPASHTRAYTRGQK